MSADIQPRDCLVPHGLEAMTQREKREAIREAKREDFRRAIWALTPDHTRAEIKEIFESEISL